MARPLPWRLDPAAYPYVQPVQTRFQDLDTLGHINNVAFAALFETARVRFNIDAGLWDRPQGQDAGGGGSGGCRVVVAMQEIHYLAEGRYPDEVMVAMGVGATGHRSWTMLAAMFQSGRPIATCDAVLVLAAVPDGEGLPDAMRGRLAEWVARGGGG